MTGARFGDRRGPPCEPPLGPLGAPGAALGVAWAPPWAYVAFPITLAAAHEGAIPYSATRSPVTIPQMVIVGHCGR